MIKILKVILSFFMCITLFACSSGIDSSNGVSSAIVTTAPSETVNTEIIETEENSEIVYQKNILFYDSDMDKRINVVISYTMDDDHIGEIKKISCDNDYDSWESVGLSEITNVDFDDTNTSAIIQFTYQASIGAGYIDYDGQVELSAPLTNNEY